MNRRKTIAKQLSGIRTVILFILIFFFLPVKLSAQYDFSDSAIRERIQCIQNMLGQDQTNTDLWWYGWLTGYSAATVTQGIIYARSGDTGTKQDMALGAVTTVLGAAGQMITPLHPGRMAGLLMDIPESTPEERLKKLAVAEELLEKTANTEKFGRSWKNHALYGAVNLGSGLITWLGFRRSIWAGIGNFALNTAVSEIQIWTQPTRSLKNYQHYCSKYKSGTIGMTSKPGPEFYVGAYPAGLGLRIVF